jgi:hypothetical protein
MSKIMLRDAKPIWDMRLSGKKPNSVVFVSLIGELNVDPTVVVPLDVQPDKCEWRWVVDLCVTLVFDEDVNKRRLWSAIENIMRQSPNGGYMPFSKHSGHMWLWNVSSKIATQMSWWKGHDAIPDYDIEGIPEEFKAYPVSRWDLKTFEEVAAA